MGAWVLLRLLAFISLSPPIRFGLQPVTRERCIFWGLIRRVTLIHRNHATKATRATTVTIPPAASGPLTINVPKLEISCRAATPIPARPIGRLKVCVARNPQASAAVAAPVGRAENPNNMLAESEIALAVCGVEPGETTAAACRRAKR